MLLKLCAKCQKPVSNNERYCSKCKPIAEKEHEQVKATRMSQYNKARDKKYTDFYHSKQWKILRDAYKSKHPLCEECEKEKLIDGEFELQLTEEIHHIEPIQTETGWYRRLEWNNLIALCHWHHDQKHNRFKRKKSGG